MISKIKNSRTLHFFFLLSAFIFSGIRANAQCDPSQKYDKIISAYHQSIALKSDGTYAAWGEAVASNAGDHLSPVDITVANGYAALGSATPLKATVGGDNDSQSILLTSNGLYTWGYSAKILDASLATVVSAKNSFQKIQTPIGGDSATGLPVGVAPADVTMLFSTFQTLAIVANGNVWVLTQTSTNLLGDGTTGTISANDKKTWHKVKINASTYLTNVVSVRGQVTSATVNALMAQTSTGEVYVWGTTTYLGNGSVFSARNYATAMTLPSEFSNTNKPKMIGVTLGSTANSFYVLSNSGALYGLGNNAKKQLGNFTTTEAKSWVQAKINASTNFTNVSFISVQEHTNQFSGVAAILSTGDLYTWGTNGGLMLGRTTDGTDYDPGVPGGFATGFDKAVSTELGGHTLVYLKEGSDRFCYVGHRTQGSMGDGTSTSTNESVFNCLATPQLSICGSVPVVASTTTSTISASPTSIVADGTSTSTITIQLKDASGNNLTTSGGTVVVTTSDGTLGTVIDNNDGTYTVLLTSSTNAGVATVGFSINGTTASNTTSVTFTAPSGGDTTPPVITGPAVVGGTTTGLNSDKTIPENTTAVYTFIASEPVTWSITGGVDQSMLSIDPNTGVISFNTAPDYEIPTDADANNTYIVIITATDAAGNATTQTLTVTVTDVDEVPPVISGPNGASGTTTGATSSKSIPENTTAVYTFTASEFVTWSISGGADQSMLSIDPNTGVVSFNAAPDYEIPMDADANNTYIVIITATDAAGNVTSQTLTVTVTDIDEIPPVITGPNGSGGTTTGATSAKSIPENTTGVYTFTANEPVTWSITGGSDQSKLSINPSTGGVSFNTAPNFEVPTDADANNTYVVIITATDAAGNVTSQTLTVTVTDVDETAPIITGPTTGGGTTTGANSAITVTENTVPVYTFTANESVTWSLGGGVDQARFTINPSTGLVSFSPAPDFENPTDADVNNTYIVIIKATDAAGNITTQTLTVTVTDVVENLAPTNITLSKMNLFEANAIGAVIGNLTTTDPDVGDTHTYTLVSGVGSTSNAYFTISGNQLKAGVIFSYITQSTYSIRIRTTDAGGLSFEKVFSITISESPTVKGTGYNLSTGITPATSNPVISKGYFSNLTVSGTNLVGYSWTPVLNLSNTNTANPTATPSQTTTYAVTVTNSFGSTTVLYITVTVVEDYNITPRNAITPNGDGKNDTWVVANITSYPNNQVRIFDRAGRLLFVESNYQNGWDGTVNGVPLKEDTYYFVITFGPGVNPKKGFISIIR